MVVRHVCTARRNQNRRVKPKTTNGRLPLSTLLSHALVAFTIEFDNESEHRMAHRTTRHGSTDGARRGPWLVSMVMWLNCMRFLDETGLTVSELARRARTSTNLRGMQRWGYIRVSEDKVVHVTSKGRRAQEVWLPLMSAIEDRWRQRFGGETIDELRASLSALIDGFDLDLPDSLPILGYGLFNHLERGSRPVQRPRDSADRPVATLLAKTLLMIALEYERESEVSLAIGANVLRLAGDDDLRVRDLPQRAGISKEAIAMAVGFLERHGFGVVATERDGSRVRVLSLTPKGRRARERYCRALEEIERSWNERYGTQAVKRLRRSLEGLLGGPTAQSQLCAGLEPYPDGWRAAVKRPQELPHFPTVLHRGGWPDGS